MNRYIVRLSEPGPLMVAFYASGDPQLGIFLGRLDSRIIAGTVNGEEVRLLVEANDAGEATEAVRALGERAGWWLMAPPGILAAWLAAGDQAGVFEDAAGETARDLGKLTAASVAVYVLALLVLAMMKR